MHNAPWVSHCLCVCVNVSVCIHVCLCVRPVMNLNYVLVWLAGPGYTSRVGDHAQWRNQGVCLLERTLTLLIPGLRSQRYDISFFHLFSCVSCVSSATYHDCMYILSFNVILPHLSLAGGSSDEGKQGGVMVEFDDGDRGKISLPNIRLLPPGYQIHCEYLLSI